MPVSEFATVSDARKNLKDLLDVAHEGGTGLVHRGPELYALVSTHTLQPALRRAVGIAPEVFFEDEGVGIALPGTPFAAEGITLDDAAADMVDALRDYAEDWARLRHAPNHQRHAALVTLIDISTDDQLTDWLTGAES